MSKTDNEYVDEIATEINILTETMIKVTKIGRKSGIDAAASYIEANLDLFVRHPTKVVEVIRALKDEDDG